MFYTDGCDALMQINFLLGVGSFNKMLSSARRLTSEYIGKTCSNLQDK